MHQGLMGLLCEGREDMAFVGISKEGDRLTAEADIGTPSICKKDGTVERVEVFSKERRDLGRAVVDLVVSVQIKEGQYLHVNL